MSDAQEREIDADPIDTQVNTAPPAPVVQAFLKSFNDENPAAGVTVHVGYAVPEAEALMKKEEMSMKETNNVPPVTPVTPDVVTPPIAKMPPVALVTPDERTVSMVTLAQEEAKLPETEGTAKRPSVPPSVRPSAPPSVPPLIPGSVRLTPMPSPIRRITSPETPAAKGRFKMKTLLGVAPDGKPEEYAKIQEEFRATWGKDAASERPKEQKTAPESKEPKESEKPKEAEISKDQTEAEGAPLAPLSKEESKEKSADDVVISGVLPLETKAEQKEAAAETSKEEQEAVTKISKKPLEAVPEISREQADAEEAAPEKKEAAAETSKEEQEAVTKISKKPLEVPESKKEEWKEKSAGGVVVSEVLLLETNEATAETSKEQEAATEISKEPQEAAPPSKQDAPESMQISKRPRWEVQVTQAELPSPDGLNMAMSAKINAMYEDVAEMQAMVPILPFAPPPASLPPPSLPPPSLPLSTKKNWVLYAGLTVVLAIVVATLAGMAGLILRKENEKSTSVKTEAAPPPPPSATSPPAVHVAGSDASRGAAEKHDAGVNASPAPTVTVTTKPMVRGNGKRKPEVTAATKEPETIPLPAPVTAPPPAAKVPSELPPHEKPTVPPESTDTMGGT